MPSRDAPLCPEPVGGPGRPGAILVALDGSRFGESALWHARRMARILDSDVHLFAALDPSLTGATVGESAECRLQMAETETYLLGLADEVRADGLHVEVDVGQGDPASEIACAAAERGADLVAVAARPRRPGEHLTSRGVALGVIASGGPSLLVARGAVPGPGNGATDAPGYRCVAVGVDGSSGSERALRLAAALAATDSSELVLIHMAGPGTEPGTGSEGGGTDHGEDAGNEILAEARERLRATETDPARATRTVRTHVRGSKTVAEELEAAALKLDSDLLVLGARGAGKTVAPFGGCARHALLHGEMPVLMLSDPARPGTRTAHPHVSARSRRLSALRRRNRPPSPHPLQPR